MLEHFAVVFIDLHDDRFGALVSLQQDQRLISNSALEAGDNSDVSR